jgi:ferredoxin
VSTTLYYFTGTGNSLWFARQMQNHISECEIEPIAQAVAKSEFAAQKEKVGFVTPLYFYGLPEIALRFIKESDLSMATYTFIVVTHGGPPFVEGGVIEQTEALMAEKGMRLDASFMQWMPGNFILWYGAFPRFVHNLQLKYAERRARKIARIVSSGESRRERGNPLITKTIAQKEYPKWLNGLSAADEGFWTTDACNACGTCEKVCPVKNIHIEDGTPQWQHTCQQCMACIQYCPKEAIQYKKVTQNRKRYRNPHIRVSEIMQQNLG